MSDGEYLIRIALVAAGVMLFLQTVFPYKPRKPRG